MPKSSNPTRRRAAAPSRTPSSRAPAPAFSPAQLRARHDGWTPEKQVRFVEALAESGCVEEACAVAMSKQSAYGLRTRIDAQGFRMAWDAAIEFAIRRLSDACLSRALNGEAVPHYYQGEQVGEHRRYDNRLAMFLLRYRDPLRYAATLDQMVYSGHPETAAFAFARARDRAAEEAQGVADTPPAPTDPAPWGAKPLAEAKAQAIEDALIESDAKVYGSFERRERIARLRRQRRGTPNEQDHAEMREQIAEKLRMMDAGYRATMMGGGVASTSSTSECGAAVDDPPVPRAAGAVDRPPSSAGSDRPPRAPPALRTLG